MIKQSQVVKYLQGINNKEEIQTVIKTHLESNKKMREMFDWGSQGSGAGALSKGDFSKLSLQIGFSQL